MGTVVVCEPLESLVLDSSPQMEKRKRRKKEGSDPCNHRADLSSVPAFRADLEGNNNQGHSGKRMQDRVPPGKNSLAAFL